jgi:predicted nuclease of predicted toxin-antitoxin system
VAESSPGITDDEVLQKAFEEERILITNDKDFGEMIYKNKLFHKGVIFLRLTDEGSSNKIAVLKKLIEEQKALLKSNNFFMVVTEKNIRINHI